MWEEFYYDETSPSRLKRRDAVMGGTNNLVVLFPANSDIGGVNGEGYFKVKHKGKTYSCHRIIYEMFHGPIPADMEIDHKDGNTKNNLITNLRAVKKEKNMRNRRKASNNTSDKTGVYKRKVMHKGVEYLAWMAQWHTLEGKRNTKTFSFTKYGEHEAFKLACEHRDAVISQLNLAGADYTERHTEAFGVQTNYI